MLYACLHNNYRGKKGPIVPQARLLDAGELHPLLPCTAHCLAAHPSPLAAHLASAGSLLHPIGEQPTQRGAQNQGLSKLLVSTLCCLRKA